MLLSEVTNKFNILLRVVYLVVVKMTDIETLTENEIRDIRKKLAFEDMSERLLGSACVAMFSYPIGNVIDAASKSTADWLYHLGFVASLIALPAILFYEDASSEQRIKEKREQSEIEVAEALKYLKQFYSK